MTFNTGETNESLKRDYNPDGSNLRNVQKRMLDMLLYLDSVCKEIHIQYRIVGGTLLGAVRHGGFIPWDDDLDVAVDGRKEWYRLRKYMRTHPHKQFVLQDDSSDKGFLNFWMTLRDTKSEYIHKDIKSSLRDKKRKYRGLQIDIFPYETRRIISLYRFSRINQRFKSRFLLGKHQRLARIFHYYQKLFLHPVLDIISLAFGNKNYYMHSYGTTWLHRYPKDAIYPLKDYMFEGHRFPGPASADKYLKEVYGNYMDLPPKDQREHHKVIIRIWD